MIKAKLTNGDLVFGLSEENVRRLKQNQPIVFNLKDMGLEDRRVMITYGTTEDELYESMLDHIEIGRTKVHVDVEPDQRKPDPRGGNPPPHHSIATS